MAEDPNKISSQRDLLNSLTTPPGDWVAVLGAFALISVTGDLQAKTNIVFNVNNGYAVKVFINQRNGEIRLFPAVLFEQNG